jgi:hypothetical protein
MRISAGTFSFVVALAGALLHTAPAWADPTGTTSEVVFGDYSPLAGNAELVRRILSPLAGAQIAATLLRSGKKLSDQAVDLANEKFVLYVPPREPPQGYGLLVFVPPWDRARLPDGWGAVLDEHGMIFVSAANSGNDANVLARRVPLALLGEENVARRYTLDPQRIFIAGFSGGSRVAMRVALDYPDLFRGAILNAGSDPIGDTRTPLPPADLFRRFQESAHLVYVTGDRDTFTLSMDLASIRSMHDWCVEGVGDETENFTDHDVISPSALARAIDALAAAHPPDAAKLAECRSTIENELAAQLRQVQSLLSAWQRDSARAALQEIDARFGGLAAPQSVELANKLDAAAH